MKKKIRTRWTETHITLLKNTFASYIKQKKYPKTEDIRKFCRTHKIDKDPIIAKAKLQNLMAKKKKLLLKFIFQQYFVKITLCPLEL